MLAQTLSANPSLLNTTTGKAADVMDTLIQHRIRHGGIEERARKLKEGDEVRASFDQAKAVSSGVMVSNGVYNLDNPELLGFPIQTRQLMSMKLSGNVEKNVLIFRSNSPREPVFEKQKVMAKVTALKAETITK